MRWSLFFLITTFVLLSIYVGWKQGAFDFKKEQMAVIETAKASQKTGLMALQVKDPLKSQLLDLIKKRRLDDAAALYEKETGEAGGLNAYRILLKLAEGETKK